MQPIYVINGVNQQQLLPPLPQVNNIQSVDAVHSFPSVHIVQPMPMIVMPQYRYSYPPYPSQIPQNNVILLQATEQNGGQTLSTASDHSYPMPTYTSAPALPFYYHQFPANPHDHRCIGTISKNQNASTVLSSSSGSHDHHQSHADNTHSNEIISLEDLKRKLKQISCDVTDVSHNDKNRNTPSSNTGGDTGDKSSSIQYPSPSTNSTISTNTDYSAINMPNKSTSASSSVSKSGNTRVYECLYCNHQFKQSHSLKDHIRTHTGEKPYQCAYCSRRFKVKYNMVVHTRIHTGVKPYVCKVCSKRYASKSGLNAHFKKHHPGQWQKKSKPKNGK
eukprot:144343_1